MRAPASLLTALSLTFLFGAAVKAAAIAEPSTPGALRVQAPDGAIVELPLRHTKVAIEVTAFVARATIEQEFGNPFQSPIEAIYTFPLGSRAAVDDFELVVGDRTIRGEIQRREDARATYERARASGYQAALLEQERPNIFTQSVANLEPGKTITVRLRTVETLIYERGIYRLTFPLVVGPRYIPGGSVADAEKISPPVMSPGTRSGHDIEIAVTIDAGVPLGRIDSPSHKTIVHMTGAAAATVRLSNDDTIPNKDFLVRWRVASDRPAVGLLAHRDNLDGFFTLLVQPKGDVGPAEAMPKEITFVIDTSGSMSGIPLEASKRFAAQALHALGPRDTFNLIRFSGDNEVYSKDPLPNERGAIERALTWLNRRQGGGGTEMLPAIAAAFARPADPNRLRVIVFLTDGYVGNDAEILAAIGKVIGDARLYTVGIGTSVNHHLLDRMADLGRGAYVFVRPDETADDALEAFRSWVTLPYLTDLSIDWGALPIADLAPERLRDLGSGQTLSIVGRYLDAAEGKIVVRGKLGGRYWEQTVHVTLPARESRNEALGALWARGRIEELLRDPQGPVPESVKAEVTALALTYRLMSAYTSFVAVDDARVVNPDGNPTTVCQALPLPEGVSFEGIFGKDGPAALRAGEEPIAEPEDVDEGDDADGMSVEKVVIVADKGVAVDLDKNQTATKFSSEYIADLPIQGNFYQNVLSLSPGAQDPDGDGNPNVNAARERNFKTQVSGISNVDPLTGSFLNMVTSDEIEDLTVITSGAGSSRVPSVPGGHLLDAAFRVLADLADDGKLSPAEGTPALAALLAAQRRSGAIADDIAVHAIATWALAEAATAEPANKWLVPARDKALDYLVGCAKPDGWPARDGGVIDAEATRWARLIVGSLRPVAVSSMPAPAGLPAEAFAQLQASLIAAKSGVPRPIATGRSPFDRLLMTIGRGHLKVVQSGSDIVRPKTSASTGRRSELFHTAQEKLEITAFFATKSCLGSFLRPLGQKRPSRWAVERRSAPRTCFRLPALEENPLNFGHFLRS